MKALKTLNAGKTYDKQIKPFNFIISCHVHKLGHPIGVAPERFHLIAPYENDPQKWETMRWIDQYSKKGKRYRISPSALHGSRTMARVKSYGDVLREYEYHPEAKCASWPKPWHEVGKRARNDIPYNAESVGAELASEFEGIPTTPGLQAAMPAATC